MQQNITKSDIFWRKDVTTPSSNRNILIFPFNFRNLQFNYSFYSPVMSDNRIDKAQINSFFEEIHTACQDFSSLRNWEDVFYITFYICLLTCSVFTIFLERKYPLLAEAVFVLGYFIPVVIASYNIVRVKKLFTQYRNKIMGIITYSNQNLYKIMGTKWVLSENNFDWIELWLEYRFEKQPNVAYFNDSMLDRRYYGGSFQYKYPVMCWPRLTCCVQNLPPSTEYCTVFPFDYKTFQYNCNFYTPNMTDFKLTHQDVLTFMRGASKYCNRFEVLSGRIVWEYLLSLIQAGLVTLGLYLVMYIEHDLFNTHKILGMAMCFIVAHFFQFFKEYGRSDAFQKVIPQLEQYIFNANQEFAEKGVRWVLSPTNIDWIELWNDFKFVDLEEQQKSARGPIKRSNEDASENADLQSLLKLDTAEAL